MKQFLWRCLVHSVQYFLRQLRPGIVGFLLAGDLFAHIIAFRIIVVCPDLEQIRANCFSNHLCDDLRISLFNHANIIILARSGKVSYQNTALPGIAPGVLTCFSCPHLEYLQKLLRLFQRQAVVHPLFQTCCFPHLTPYQRCFHKRSASPPRWPTQKLRISAFSIVAYTLSPVICLKLLSPAASTARNNSLR